MFVRFMAPHPPGASIAPGVAARSGLVALLEQPLALALPLAFALGFALVVLLLALGQADLELDPAARVVQVERHQRVAGALDLADQLVDLRGVKQELARARGV